MGEKNKAKNGAAAAVTPPGSDSSSNGFSLISNEKLIALYAHLLKFRIVGQRLAGLQGKGATNGFSFPIRGYEAGTVGVAIHLSPEDAVCSPNHGLLTGFSHGAPIEALLAELANRVPGKLHSSNAHLNGATRNGRTHARFDPAYTQAAIGAALANKTRKNGKVAVVFGIEEEPTPWNDALQIASVHGLPMIFVNQTRPKTGLAGRDSRSANATQPANPQVAWFPNIAVDSSDVVAVYRVATEAISRARQGRGPTLIECRALPVNGKQQSYKGANVSGREAHDPILNMESYLRAKGLFRRTLKSDIVADFTRQLNKTMNLPKNYPLRPER